MFLSLFRLGAAALLFLLSLMVVVRAIWVPLWYTAVVVTEWGHGFALGSFGLAAWELAAHPRHPNLFILAPALLSCALFLKPRVQARWIARKLPARLAAVFGEGGRPEFPPLRDATLWGLTPRPVAEEREFKYMARDGTLLPLRLYTDGRPGIQPGILMIHGGGWNSGDERQLASWNRRLAALGYRVVSIRYRLAPRFHWPAQKEDVIAALDFLKTHAGEMGLDATRLVIFGRSAGGHIALATAYALGDPAVRGCVALYPPTDMNFSYWTGKEDDMLGSRPLVRALMGALPADDPALYHDASPLDFVGPETPPTLLVHGTRDEVVWVRHSERLRERMRQAGRPVFLLELPWATHGFDALPRGPGSQLQFYAMAWFLNAVLRE